MEKHSLLARQLKKYSPSGEGSLPVGWERFLNAVNDAYLAFDDDRKILETSMELSSTEIIQANDELKRNEQKLKETLTNLQKAHEELKGAQAQLLQAEKLASLGQLAAGIAHEINNPVSFVYSNIRSLEDYMAALLKSLTMMKKVTALMTQDKSEEARALITQLNQMNEEINLDFILNDIPPLLKESENGLERIKEIVMDLRTFSREDKDEITEAPLHEIIEGTLNIVMNEVKYKADVKKIYDDTLPLIKGNEQKLSQVFMNLIVNAAQAIENHGLITIKTSQKDTHVCVDISDTGPGIPQETLPKIFDPFFTTKPVGHGTGLGLSISYEIIKKHGGDIKVQSQAGQGTTFTVMLPKTRQEKKACES